VAIARGGLIPAQIIAHDLEIEYVHSIGIKLYDKDKPKVKPIVYSPLDVDFTGKQVLLVDEIADSGRTFEKVISILKEHGANNIITATCYHKPHSKFKPDVIGKKVKSNVWYEMPYEKDEDE
jgi:hypothetical protein